MAKLKVALIQMDIALGQIKFNQKKAFALIEEAHKMGADLVALPELWTTGYHLQFAQKLVQEDNGTTIQLLQKKAQHYRMDILAGSILEAENEKIYNTSYYINANGQILAKYRKIHLFGLMEEEKFLSPGTEVKYVSTRFGEFGLMTCYDLRFPELARKLTLGGVKGLLIPAEFPHPRRNHWRILNMARAIENQVYVMAVNRVGKDANSDFFGSSMVVSPWGETIAEGSDKEEVIIAEIDLTIVEKIRNKIPSLMDRKPELY